MDLPLLDGTLDSLEEGEESQGDSQEEGTSTLMEVDSISTQVGLVCGGGRRRGCGAYVHVYMHAIGFMYFSFVL